MNAKQHYLEAERILEDLNDLANTDTLKEAAQSVAIAQVHATLAQAGYARDLSLTLSRKAHF